MIERREAVFLASFLHIDQPGADWEIRTRRHIIGSDYGHPARTRHQRAFFQSSVGRNTHGLLGHDELRRIDYRASDD